MFRTSFIGGLVSLAVEKYAPLVVSGATALAIYLWREDICAAIADKSLNMGNLYSTVLSWASIQIGFAFGVYGFVIGKTQGFIEAVRDTATMHRLMLYVKRANLGGFLLTFVSLPLATIVPTPKIPDSTTFYVVSVWFVLFVWTFLAFLRIAFNFGHLTGVRDRPDFHGA